MTESSQSRLEETIFAVLREYVRPTIEITMDAELIQDLEIDSEDTVFMADDLERQLKVRTPLDEWRRVWTVRDLIDLFKRHLKV